jgi:hypothetical protein
MASPYNKFQSFGALSMNGGHNLSTAAITIALCAAANPPSASNAVLNDIVQVAYTNLSARVLTTTSSTQSSGVYKLICQDLILTASGGVATFRYVVAYNGTAAGGPLIAWWDYSSDVTLAATETFTVKLDQANGVFSFS